MSKLKSTLLYGLLLSCVAVMPVTAFGSVENNTAPKAEQADNKLPTTEQTAFRFYAGYGYGRGYDYGRGYGRGYYYRPYYYSYPYRPYYYRNYYNRPYYW